MVGKVTQPPDGDYSNERQPEPYRGPKTFVAAMAQPFRSSLQITADAAKVASVIHSASPI